MQLLLAVVVALWGPCCLKAGEVYAVFKSRDRGVSWVRADRGLPAASRVNALGAIEKELLAGTDSGIFHMTDEARGWQLASGPAAVSARTLCFATLGQTVFAGTDGSGVLASSDHGRSWVRQLAFPSPKVRCLLARDGLLYAGTDAEGVFCSHDAGRSWQPLSTGLPDRAQVFALAAIEDQVFAGLYSRGLYAWDRSRDLWSRRNTVVPLALAVVGDTLIAGHNPGGLYRSPDRGLSWSKGTAKDDATALSAPGLAESSGELTPEAPVWEMAADDRLVVAGASAGIYLSADAGRTWVRARGGLPEGSPGIAFLVRPNLVLAGLWMSGRRGANERGAGNVAPKFVD